MAPMAGVRMSPTSELTIAPKAAPMITPMARSTALPRNANFLNSSSMRCSHAAPAGSSADGEREVPRVQTCDPSTAGLHRTRAPPNVLGGEPGSNSPGHALVDQPRVDHRLAHGGTRFLRQRNHRQP